jgi:hypothetical protein
MTALGIYFHISNSRNMARNAGNTIIFYQNIAFADEPAIHNAGISDQNVRHENLIFNGEGANIKKMF